MSSSISFSGLGSGIDYSSWIDALCSQKQSAITSLQTKVSKLNTTSSNISTLKTNYTSLLSAITKLTDANLSSSADVFAKSKVTSSNSNLLSITGSTGAAQQTLNVDITQLATNSTAKAAGDIGNLIGNSTTFSSMANGAAKTGTFSFFVDNQKYSINIASDDTLGSISGKMVDATKSTDNPDGLITTSITNGKLSLSAGTKTMSLGTTQDTSNFATVLGLKKSTDSTSYQSSNTIYDINLNKTLTGTESGLKTQITAGKFTIGNAEFTVDNTTTLNSLIGKINSSATAGVSANYDSTTGKVVLTSKSTGAFNINVQDGTSNALSALGFTSGGKIATDSQTLGKNAIFSINGKTVESFSNTVTSESTGLTGLTFNLLGATTTSTGSVNVQVQQDNSTAISAIQDLVTQFNNVISKTDSIESSDSNLKYETSLTSLRNQVRSNASYYADTGTTYKSLADIGITTGSVGTAVSADTDKLTIDTDKLTAALNTNPSAVKELLIGDTKKGTTGLAGQLKKVVNLGLDTTNGYFTAKNTEITSQLKSLNDQISRRQDSLTTYRATITKQFEAMDSTISKLKGQYSNFSTSSSSSK